MCKCICLSFLLLRNALFVGTMLNIYLVEQDMCIADCSGETKKNNVFYITPEVSLRKGALKIS